VLLWSLGSYVLTSARGETKELTARSVPAPLQLTGAWDLNFPEGWGAPASTCFDKLMPWNTHSHTDIEHFSGTATYHKVFDVPAELTGADRCVALDLGNVKNVAEVWLNGKPLGILWKGPFRVDVSKALKSGKNTIKIVVTGPRDAASRNSHVVVDAFRVHG